MASLKNLKKFCYLNTIRKSIHLFRRQEFSIHKSARSYEGKDPCSYFFDKNVQHILKSLTKCDVKRVFENRHLEDPESVVDYKFLSKEEYDELMETSTQEAHKLLQMPPVLKVREPIDKILSQDPALKGVEEPQSKLVISDISFGVSDRERIIVVRDPDGTLRQASWEERDRIIQIYNPRPGRYLNVPPVFEEKNLIDALNNEQQYKFLLDFACAQFEPDDPEYHRVTETIFEHIRNQNRFGDLDSTRHFGPMVFYFVWTQKIDKLLSFYLDNEQISDGGELVQLYYFINDKEKYSQLRDLDSTATIKKFIENDSKMKGKLELSLQKYLEKIREREQLQNQIKSADGFS